MAPVRLSAIICNYNHAAYLPQALCAMLECDRPPDELIVVDDASTDGSREIIDEFAARDSRIRLICHERNQGWHAGTAHALQRATGNWIYSGAADDYVLPSFFARALQMIERWPEAGIICGSTRKITPDGRLLDRDAMPGVVEPVFLSPDDYRRYICRRSIALHSFAPATILRREAIEAAGGYRPELGHWADTFVIRIAGLRWGMAYFPEEAVCFRVFPNSISASGHRNVDQRLRIIGAVAQLMRSPEFVNDFPPGYGDWWTREAILAMRLVWSDQMDAAWAHVMDPLLNPHPGQSRLQYLLLWLCRKLLSATYRWTRYCTASAQTARLLWEFPQLRDLQGVSRLAAQDPPHMND